MADFIRAQIAAWNSADLPINAVTNTVYFKATDALFGGADTNDPDWDALANDLHTIVSNATYFYAGCNTASVKIYDMEESEPREPKAIKQGAIQGRGSMGVREVALCLSFRGENNTARTRGRIYLGPITETYTRSSRPESTVTTAALAFATSLANLGGTNIDWCVYSPTTHALAQGGDLSGAFHPVKLSWVDNAWDTVRSRGLEPNARTTQAHDE